MKWVSPDTKEHLKELKNKGTDEILIVPVSFLTENLETLYDLDREIIPFAKNELGIRNIERVYIPPAHSLLTETFQDLIQTRV